MYKVKFRKISLKKPDRNVEKIEKHREMKEKNVTAQQ